MQEGPEGGLRTKEPLTPRPRIGVRRAEEILRQKASDKRGDIRQGEASELVERAPKQTGPCESGPAFNEAGKVRQERCA